MGGIQYQPQPVQMQPQYYQYPMAAQNQPHAPSTYQLPFPNFQQYGLSGAPHAEGLSKFQGQMEGQGQFSQQLKAGTLPPGFSQNVPAIPLTPAGPGIFEQQMGST